MNVNAGKNENSNVLEMLDCGADVNVGDLDRGNTPLHMAASFGQKGTLELLVARGADVNKQDKRGVTALHTLILKRYDIMALWLIRQGADVNKPDYRGHTPRDLALGWFQKEIDEAVENRDSDLESQAAAAKPVVAPPPQSAGQPEYLKIHIGTAYKSVKVEPADSVQTLINQICDKLALPPAAKNVVEVEQNIQGKVDRLGKTVNLLDNKRKWPTILNATGNTTNEVCFYQVILRNGAPPDVAAAFNAAAGLSLAN